MVTTKGGRVHLLFSWEPEHETVCGGVLDRHVNDGGEVSVEIGCDVTDYDSGMLDGPPENCYPPEGGNAYLDASDVCVEIEIDGGHRMVMVHGEIAADIVEHFEQTEYLDELACDKLWY